MLDWFYKFFHPADQTERYIANAGEEPLYVLSEEKESVKSGIFVKTVNGCTKCINGNDPMPLIELAQRDKLKLKEKNQAITIATKNCEILCHGYALPDYRGIIVRGERKELAKQGEIWTGESGKEYKITERKQEKRSSIRERMY